MTEFGVAVNSHGPAVVNLFWRRIKYSGRLQFGLSLLTRLMEIPTPRKHKGERRSIPEMFELFRRDYSEIDLIRSTMRTPLLPGYRTDQGTRATQPGPFVARAVY
jgi:hypothetical protein